MVMLAFAACRNTELEDLLNDPNNANPNSAELDLVFAEVMLDLGAFVDEVSDETMPYVRMIAMTGGNQYDNQDSPQSFDQMWRDAYSEMFPDIDLVISLAEGSGSTFHSGVAKTVKAYVLYTMVDLFGNIPYSEAGQGIENPQPNADDDAAVYDAANGLVDQAISDLSNSIGESKFDIYYDNDSDAWLKLARSLKLRAAVQTRLAGGDVGVVNSLMDQVISENGDDFQFQYGTFRNVGQEDESRHPYYIDGYEVNGPGVYMSNYLMWSMFADKNAVDPRIRYYFYRQDCDEELQGNGDPEEQFTIDCPLSPYPAHWPAGLPFCTASLFEDNASGYWGRDHGDDSGIPPDGQKRTAWGVYPAGGSFDADQSCNDPTGEAQVSNSGADGGQGAGIQPILLASMMDLYKAEAVLTMGANGDARALLESGVRKSIAKVMDFGASTDPGPSEYVPTSDDVDAYVNEVLLRFDAASSTESKLNVVITELWLASHGNGLEAFNSYRRTGSPTDMQPTLEPDPGNFPRLMFYPSVYVNLNANASQRALTEQVFWDTNPPGFIK